MNISYLLPIYLGKITMAGRRLRSGRHRTAPYLDEVPQLRTTELARHQWRTGLLLDVIGGGAVVGQIRVHEDAVQWFSPAGTAWIPLLRQPKPFGGCQTYLQCIHCRCPCRILYLASESMRCRRCIGLHYRSQGLDKLGSAIYQQQRIISKIGYPETDFSFPTRPSRMRRETYLNLHNRFSRQVQKAIQLTERLTL